MRFTEYIALHMRTPFKWGEHDCITFAVGWLNLRTGKDWLADLPEWNTQREAHMAIRTIGSLEEEFDKQLTRINPRCARDGDIGLLDRTVYLFSGAYAVGPGPDGLLFIERKNVLCAWSY